MPSLALMALVAYTEGMTEPRRKTESIRLTGLTLEEKRLIEDAAHYARQPMKEWAIRHAQADMSDAQAVIYRASKDREG